MDELSMKFNRMIMSEMGFEVRDRQRLYDQDNGTLLQFDGKDIVAPGAASGREAIEFDPYNSTKMMAQLFSYYTDKLVENGEIDEYDVIYNVDLGNGKGKVTMKNDTDSFTSGVYQRDQCKYADLMLQLNGDDKPDLKEFDIPKTKKEVKRPRKTNTDRKEKKNA